MKVKHFIKDVFFPEDWWKATLALIALIVFLMIVLPGVLGWFFGPPGSEKVPERYEEFLR